MVRARGIGAAESTNAPHFTKYFCTRGIRRPSKHCNASSLRQSEKDPIRKPLYVVTRHRVLKSWAWLVFPFNCGSGVWGAEPPENKSQVVGGVAPLPAGGGVVRNCAFHTEFPFRFTCFARFLFQRIRSGCSVAGVSRVQWRSNNQVCPVLTPQPLNNQGG